MKKYLIKGKNIAVIGALSWILGFVTSASNNSGRFVMPALLIAISGLVTFLFIVLAIIRLWKSEKVLIVAYIFLIVALAALTLVQELTLPQYGSPIILLLNITKVVNLIVFVYIICLLWAKSKYEGA